MHIAQLISFILHIFLNTVSTENNLAIVRVRFMPNTLMTIMTRKAFSVKHLAAQRPIQRLGVLAWYILTAYWTYTNHLCIIASQIWIRLCTIQSTWIGLTFNPNLAVTSCLSDFTLSSPSTHRSHNGEPADSQINLPLIGLPHFRLEHLKQPLW